MKIINKAERKYHLACCDWKEQPAELLNTIDELLILYGLEVVMLETNDDTYVFGIAKKHQDKELTTDQKKKMLKVSNMPKHAPRKEKKIKLTKVDLEIAKLRKSK